ncbi:DUF3305 domain-containing protein [Herminiimonas sp. CN]|uniref:DUF3305 domain-containing protein n=1 Tax=Herminiimonas sp. CN TaxID=1349818 RepID=UPI000473FC62|nr:DUF3305 domain-containing protein [Herminiimonas sp. CN]
METQAIDVSVIMQRKALDNRWQSHQWLPLEVLDTAALPPGGARCLLDDVDDTRWIFPGFAIKLFSDEGEGYYLNLSSAVPCWFIMWRIEQIGAQEVAVPKAVTLSYNEAARLMDGGEQVETLPASAAIIERLSMFTQQHYQSEVKRKRKKPSFEGGAGVDRMAQAEGKDNGSR